LRLKELLTKLKSQHPKQIRGLKELSHEGNSRDKIYHYGHKWIIKEKQLPWWENTRGEKLTKASVRRELEYFGLRPAKEWPVGEWIVQPYYREYEGEEFESMFLDLHSGNIGVRRDGQLVVFDY
jgi:hypothetical protein